jgi:hypothetical protein
MTLGRSRFSLLLAPLLGLIFAIGIHGSANAATPDTFPGADYFVAQNYHTGLCLDAGSQDFTVSLATCDFSGDDHAQDWELLTSGSFPAGYYELENYHTGQCMSDQGIDDVEVIACDGNHAMLWSYTYYTGDVGNLLKDYHTGQCLGEVEDSPAMQACDATQHGQEYNFYN